MCRSFPPQPAISHQGWYNNHPGMTSRMPIDFDGDEGNASDLEAATNTPTEPVYIFENGSVATDEELIRAGLGPWIRALTWFGHQLLELAMGDHSTVAGLSALVLINYQSLSGKLVLSLCYLNFSVVLKHENASIVERSDLENSSEIYTVHHRFVEMLKSHCCSPTTAAVSGTGSYSGCYPSEADPTTMVSPARADSTYFSQVFRKKETVHRIASQLLLQPLQRLHSSGRIAPTSWLNTLVRLLNSNCSRSQTSPSCS